jgi:hypothetical protein
VEALKPSDVTGIILTYNRFCNVPIILDELKAQGVDKFVVWVNDCHPQNGLHTFLLRKYSDVSVITSPRNCICFGRYLAALVAPTKFVYVQDDDSRPGPIKQLLESAANNPDRISTFLDPGHFKYSMRGGYRLDILDARETLVGYGAVFHKGLVRWLLTYDRLYEIDDLFDREADRIFAMLLNRPHIEIPHDVKHLPGASDENALFRQPGHNESRQLARERCRRLLSQ